eukprot:GHVS01081472.1.p1 GENE.GHVS01081472.1~~GHVS01081472.1.p1  ORF type:complete len:424 (+),score=90.77 GHVS01081472.1:188-1459(+)
MVEVSGSIYPSPMSSSAVSSSPVLPQSIKGGSSSPPSTRVSEAPSLYSSPSSSAPGGSYDAFGGSQVGGGQTGDVYRQTQRIQHLEPSTDSPEGKPLSAEEELQRTALVRAATANDKQYIEFVMNKTRGGRAGETVMDINGAADENSEYSCLHIACACSSVDVVRCLVNAHHSTVTTDVRSATFQHTPLHRAAVKGHLEVLKLLLEAGAAIDATTQWGCTALHLAATNGHCEVVEELLIRGAKADTVTQFGSRALLSAAYNLHCKAVSLLLNNGSDINQRNQKGLTALHLAVQQNSYEMILLLLHHGANATLVDGCGRTPLQTAVALAASKKIIELLQSVNVSGVSGVTIDIPGVGGATSSTTSSREGDCMYSGSGGSDDEAKEEYNKRSRSGAAAAETEEYKKVTTAICEEEVATTTTTAGQ